MKPESKEESKIEEEPVQEEVFQVERATQDMMEEWTKEVGVE